MLSGEWCGTYSREPRQSIIRGRIIQGKFPEFCVGIWDNKNLSVDKKANLKIEPYNGEIFSVKLPTNNALITRRNGKILIA